MANEACIVRLAIPKLYGEVRRNEPCLIVYLQTVRGLSDEACIVQLSIPKLYGRSDEARIMRFSTLAETQVYSEK